MDAHDVVVVGAGVAGLAAAGALAEAGVDVVVLDARDRPGGRVCTVLGAHAEPMELGAEFVHGDAPCTTALARAARVDLDEMRRRSWWWRDGRVVHAPDLDEALHATVDRVACFLGGRTDRSFADALTACGASEPGRSLALEYVESFDAADAARISARSLAMGDLGGMRTRRVVGGYGRLVAALAAHLPAAAIRLRRVVRHVRWSPASVEIATTTPEGDAAAALGCRRAILALPLPVLRDLTFEPALSESAAKAGALRRVAVGPAVRVVVAFERPFWSGTVGSSFFLHAHAAEFPIFWSGSGPDSTTLVAWAGGARAARLSGATTSDLTGRALSILSRVFATPRAVLEAATIDARSHDWTLDPYSRGAYSYPLVGGSDAAPSLAAPLGDTLFFAGEFTCPAPANGTVEGAIDSGRRAASEALRSLERRVPLRVRAPRRGGG